MLFDYSAVPLTSYCYYILHHPLDETQIKAWPSVYSVTRCFSPVAAAVWYWNHPRAGKCFQWRGEHLTHRSSQTFQYETLFFFDRHFSGGPVGRESLPPQCICCLCDWFWAVDLRGKLFRKLSALPLSSQHQTWRAIFLCINTSPSEMQMILSRLSAPSLITQGSCVTDKHWPVYIFFNIFFILFYSFIFLHTYFE